MRRLIDFDALGVVFDDVVVVEVVVGFGLLNCVFDGDDDEIIAVCLGRLVATSVGLDFVFEVTIRRLVDFDTLGLFFDADVAFFTRVLLRTTFQLFRSLLAQASMLEESEFIF